MALNRRLRIPSEVVVSNVAKMRVREYFEKLDSEVRQRQATVW